MRREREKSKERETGREVFVMEHDVFLLLLLLFCCSVVLVLCFYHSAAVYEAGGAPTLSFPSSVCLTEPAGQPAHKTTPSLSFRSMPWTHALTRQFKQEAKQRTDQFTSSRINHMMTTAG
jgi:hypothetical protein